MTSQLHRVMQVDKRDNEESRRLIRMFWDIQDTLRVYPETLDSFTLASDALIDLVAYVRFTLGFTVE